MDDLKEANEGLRQEIQHLRRKLSERDSFYRRVFENAGAPIMVIEEDTTISRVNRAFEKYSGYRREELEGVKSWREFVAPEDLARLQEYHDQRRVRSGVPAHYEFVFLTSSGERRFAAASVAMLPDTGQSSSTLLDITEIKRAVQALQESEHRYRCISEASPAVVSVNRADDGAYVQVSDSYTQITGYTLEEVKGKSPLELGMYVDLAERQRLREAFAEHGEVNGMELRYRVKNGDIRNILLSGRLVRFEGQDCIISVSVDITDLKKAEAERAQTEERFRLVVDHSHDGIVFIDDQFRLTYVNQEFCRIMGYSSDELVGQDFRRFVADSSREMASKKYQQRRKGEEPPTRYQFEVVRKDGQLRLVETSSTLITDSQGGVITVAQLLDITDRSQAEAKLKASEERYRSVMEAAYEPMVVYDNEGKVQYINPAFTRVFGWRAEEVMNRILDFVPPEEAERSREHVDRNFREGGITGFETRRLTKSGQLLDVSISAAVMKGPNGAVEGSVVNISDISKLKRHEQELIQHREHLAELVEDRTKELTDTNMMLNCTIQELRHRTREALALNHMADLLQACEADEESYGILINTCRQLFPSDGGFLAITDKTSNLAAVVRRWGDLPPMENEFEMSDCWALRRGRLHAVADPAVDPVCPHLTAPPHNGSICAPVSAQGEFLGMLHVYMGRAGDEEEDQPPGRRDLEREQNLLQSIVERYAPALANLRLRDRLRQQSVRDPLTGLHNRRFLMESLSRELLRARREECSVGLMMIDVDHFKQFNDNYGHDVGDLVLQELGGFLRKQARDHDLVCRYGGEEFVLALPGAPAEVVLSRARHLVDEVRENLGVRAGGREHHVTISLGVAVYPSDGDDPASLISEADAALYRAKERGRDRVATSEGTKASISYLRTPQEA